jgi:sensor histidine kinase regulating citrate/malate metabolism
LSSLIGNLVDNAIEACQHLDDPSSKTINLCIKPSRGNLLISISNPTDGRYLTDSEGRLLSTKNESGHGIGLERVRSIVEGHNGYLQILPSAELFSVRIVLPLASAQDDQNQNME